MLYTLLGVLAFLMFMGFDICSLHNKKISKYVFAFVGLVCILGGTTMLAITGDKVIIEDSVRIISYLLALVFFALLVYSVFVEVGKNTYEVDAKPKLVTDGTYSLVRHPGVIWFWFLYLFMSIANANLSLFYAGLIWASANTVYTYLQEKLILYRLFHDYNEYSKTTPMFIPSIKSIKKFITSENWRK